jgi:hypothetical protein
MRIGAPLTLASRAEYAARSIALYRSPLLSPRKS